MAGKAFAVLSDSQHNQKDEREENDIRFMQNYVKADVPKKKTTFKITSVTKSSQRGGSGDLLLQENDLDLDSLDDLDETVDSHTEDLSSEILDTSSKATDVDSQDPLLTPEEIIKENEPKEKPARFKVVKVETKEPFKRGRWVCCDFLDAPEKTENKVEEIGVKSGNSSATNSVHFVHGVDDPTKNPLLAGATGTVSSYQQPAVVWDVSSTVNYTQGEMFKPIQPASSSHPTMISDPANQMSSFSGQGAQSSASTHFAAQTGVPDHSMGQVIPAVNSQPLRSGGSVPILPPVQQGQTQTSQSLSGTIPFPTPDGQSRQLPTPQSSMIPSGGHSHIVSVAGSLSSQHQPSQQTPEYVNAAVQGQVNASQGQQVPSYQQQMIYHDRSSQQPNFSLNNGVVSNAGNISVGNNVPNMLGHLATATSPYDGYRSEDSQLSVNSTALNNLASLQPEGREESRPTLGAGLAQIAVGGVTNAAGPANDDMTEEAFLQYFSNLSAYGSSGLFPPIMEESGVPQSSRQPPIASRRPSLRTQVRNHIGTLPSGTSTVAIDNKIEQAMDLVKSHLMYAVREEVEVLKEVIKELMERMHKVEQENKLLRSEANPETLAKLPPPLPPVQNPLLQQFMVSLHTPSSSSS